MEISEFPKLESHAKQTYQKMTKQTGSFKCKNTPSAHPGQWDTQN